MRILKEILRKNEDPHLALLTQRTTPLLNGLSPSQLLMGRRMRTRLPVIPSTLLLGVTSLCKGERSCTKSKTATVVQQPTQSERSHTVAARRQRMGPGPRSLRHSGRASATATIVSRTDAERGDKTKPICTGHNGDSSADSTRRPDSYIDHS